MSQTEKKNTKIFILSLLINAAIMAALILLFTPIFETNDDTGLLAIVCGARGVRDPHMVHSNYLMGLLLTNLFRFFPNTQWTAALQYAVLLGSFTSITHSLFEKFKKPFIRFMIVAALFWFEYEAYVKIQYTKTAGITVAIGLMVLFAGLLKEKINYVQIGVGFAFAIIGSFYRMQAFYCGVALFAPMVIYLILTLNKQRELARGRIANSLIIGVALIAVAVGFRVYDRAQYNSPEWSSYLEFDKYRTAVIDYGVPDYKENEEKYNALGIDKTAYDIMKEWTFQDSEKFTAETFKEISQLKARKQINLNYIRNFIKALAKGLLREKTFLCFSIIALGWLALGKRKSAELLTIIVLALMILTLYFYLYYAGRFMIHRVDVGIWMGASLIVLFLYNPTASDRVAIILGVALLIMFASRVSWSGQLTANQEMRLADSNRERGAIEAVNADREHIYLTKVGTLSQSKAYGVFEAMPLGISENVYPLGGWGAETPLYKSVLKKYEIMNPFRDMIDNEKVYLIDNDINKTLNYLKHWYNPNARAEVVDTISGKQVYRIVTD